MTEATSRTTDAVRVDRPLSGRVLVLNAHKRQAVVAVRSLGRRGLEITAASRYPFSAAGVSRHVARRLRHPSPLEDPDGFVDALVRELRRRRYDVVIPMSIASLEPILERRERVAEHAVVPCPATDSVVACLDKACTAEVAERVGLQHPRTLVPDDLDVDRVASVLGYPVVVKQRRGAGRVGVAVCHDRTDLEREYERIRAAHGPPLVQEFVPNGGEYGVYTLYNRTGDLRAATVQRRLRSFPPEGGASTLRETVDRPDLIRTADEFLTALDWEGVAMVEFRTDAGSGEPVLLEVNPRFWGSLALSVAAGPDFPWLLYQVATTGDCEPHLRYTAGIEARRLVGDVAHLLAREDRLQGLREVLAPTARPRYHDVFSVRDPLPFVSHAAHEAVTWLVR